VAFLLFIFQLILIRILRRIDLLDIILFPINRLRFINSRLFPLLVLSPQVFLSFDDLNNSSDTCESPTPLYGRTGCWTEVETAISPLLLEFFFEVDEGEGGRNIL